LAIKNESLEDSANLPEPSVLALEVAEELEAALEQFATIAEDLEAAISTSAKKRPL
jgi:type I restriction enzyme M protein